jgi:P-type Cu+ transporter
MIVPLILALGLLFHPPALAAADGDRATKEALLTVRGMFCSSCSGSVEQELRKLDGVVEVKVDTRKDAVLIKYYEKKVTPEKMMEMLRKVGYPARLPAR